MPLALAFSPDLVSWTPLATLMGGQAVDVAWVIPGWSVLSKGWFRAHSLPTPAGDEVARWSENGHDYHVVRVFQGVDWSTARAAAEALVYRGRRGHLAAITSPAEQAWIQTHPGFRAAPDESCWLGGYREPGSPEPGDGWRWVTGETFEFTHWITPQEGDGAAGQEGVMRLSSADGRWHHVSAQSSPRLPAFLVEYED